MSMKFEELDLEPAVVDSLRKQGYSDLYPPQEDALPAALEGKSIVLAVPTASGKSLVAYLSIVSAVLKGKRPSTSCR